MKTRLSLVAVILLTGVIFSSCKKDPPPPKTDEEVQTEKLARTWVLAAGAGAVTIAGNDVSADWASFELTFTDGGYTTTGAAEADVWPANGTWSFATDDISTMLRSDGTEISVNVTETALLLQFDFSLAGGRLDGIEGNWVFNMVPK